MGYQVYTFNGYHNGGLDGSIEGHYFKSKLAQEAFIEGVKFAGKDSDISHSTNLDRLLKHEDIFSIIEEMTHENILELKNDHKNNIFSYLDSCCDISFSLNKKDFDRVNKKLEKLLNKIKNESN